MTQPSTVCRRRSLSLWTLAATAVALLAAPAPGRAAAGETTEFLTGRPAGTGATSIARGPDGNLWFGGAGAVGRMTPAGGVTLFTFGFSALTVKDVAPSPDGTVWFTADDPNSPGGKRIGQLTPATGSVVTTLINSGDPNTRLSGLTQGPDGNVWFTESADAGTNRVWRRTPNALTPFPVTAGSRLIDITVGPDGNLWFTEAGTHRIGRITPSGDVTEFLTGITPGSEPFSIAAGPDGNLWFTERAGNRVGRITTSGVITEFSAGISPGSAPTGIAGGPDGNVWFTEGLGDRVARITPAGVITEFSTGITPGSSPGDITAGPDGNVWFVSQTTPRIGRVSAEASPPPAAGQPAGPPGATQGPAQSGPVTPTAQPAQRLAARLAATTFKRRTGTKLTLSVAVRARVTVVLERVVRGRKRKGRPCSRTARRGPRCLVATGRRSVAYDVGPGAGPITFGKRLKKGSWRARISTPGAPVRTLRFKVT